MRSKSLDSAEAILTTIRPDQPGYGDAQAELGWVREDRWTLLPDSKGGRPMLYAARAALPEHDEYARRHGGTWNLFRQRYVATDAAKFVAAVAAMLEAE